MSSTEWSIGGMEISSRALLAPMAGFGDVAFRRLCREYGAGLTTTEMVSVNGLKYGSVKTGELLKRAAVERPCAVQLFGSDPETFRFVAANCECLKDFEIVDINMGCPMPKVTKQGAGSALLADAVKASEIVRACIEGFKRPVTVKMRLGISSADGAEKFAAAMQEAGAAAIAVHGRTARQMYSGTADWTAIARVKRALSVPVIGNGDVSDKEDFKRRLIGSGADAVMIGRGALARPQVFSDILGLPSGGTVAAALRHVDYMTEYYPDAYAAKLFRKYAVHYLKGKPRSKEIKLALVKAESVSQVRELLRAFAETEKEEV